MPLNIYLVGFMGTGKTVVGKQTARQLGREFFDLDSLIEQRQKRQISQIFAEQGEAYFRRLEKEMLQEISLKKNLVISCGGGIVLDEQNIRIMKQGGLMICLSAKPEVILGRTRGQMHRPLLNVDNPQDKIEQLLKMRAPFYAQADYVIDTSGLPVSEVVNKVLEYAKAKNA
jgi:shikimate kinase